jgi:Rrf2 family protein
MKLSARSRYAARLLLELAQHAGAAPIKASYLAERTGISVQFIEQIIKPLKKGGLVHSLRGASGGHSLAVEPQDVTLARIVEIMEDGISLTKCCAEGWKPSAWPTLWILRRPQRRCWRMTPWKGSPSGAPQAQKNEKDRRGEPCRSFFYDNGRRLWGRSESSVCL